jgi:hypothetical protein
MRSKFLILPLMPVYAIPCWRQLNARWTPCRRSSARSPGGILGVACVEYGGLILADPHEPLLRRFYAIREQLWQLDASSDPYRGRTRTGHLHDALGISGLCRLNRGGLDLGIQVRPAGSSLPSYDREPG